MRARRRKDRRFIANRSRPLFGHKTGHEVLAARVLREVATAPNGLDALAQLLRHILEVNERTTTDELLILLRGDLERAMNVCAATSNESRHGCGGCAPPRP